MSDFAKALEHEALHLEAELARDPRYIKLQEVKRLRAIYAGQQNAPTLAYVQQETARQVRIAPRTILSGIGLEAVKATRNLLAHRPTPVLTRDVLDHLEGLGIKFGGASAQATLAAILSRTPEFESKGGRVGWVLKSAESTGGSMVEADSPPVAEVPPSSPVEPEAGGGT